MVRLKEKVFTLGRMVKFMMGVGYKVLNKDMEFGEVFLMIHISVNGFNLKLMDMECIHGKMVTDMKENGTCV